MTVLYLVRHAVTGHTGTRLSGRMPGISLSDEGRVQAEAVAARLRSADLKSVYSSPLERTDETATAIAQACGLKVRHNEAFLEVEYGKWSNRSLKSLMQTKLWTQVRSWPSSVPFPEGETIQEVQARAVAGAEELRMKHPKDRICIVSHGDVIKLLVAHYIGIHIDLFQRIVIAPGSFSVIAIGIQGPAVLALNVVPEIDKAVTGG